MKKLITIVLFIITISNASNTTNKQTDLDITLSLISSMSETVHSLQQERGASCGYVSSNGKEFKHKLDEIKKRSDEKIKDLHLLLKNNHRVLGQYVSLEQYKVLDDTLNTISIMRKDIQNLNINFSKIYSKYTQSISLMLLKISDISDMIENKELNDALYGYSTLLMYKESIGQKRAALSALFSKKNISKKLFS